MAGSSTRAGAAALLAAVALLLLPSVAAHGFQESSTPAPNSRHLDAPEQIRIRMTEPVEVGQTKVRVLDAHGTDHAEGPVRSPDGASQSSELVQDVRPLPNGTYVVAWKTLWLSDGHITEGAFAFVVGNQTMQALEVPLAQAPLFPGPAEWTFRALGFAGWILAAGALAYPALVAQPAWREHPRSIEGMAWVRRRSGALATIAGGLALVGAAGFYLDQASRADLGLAELAAATSVGRVLAARIALAVALVAVAAFAWRRGRGHLAGALVGAAGLLTLTLASHARAADAHTPGASVADYAHLLAAAAWVGVIAMLLATLPATLRMLSPEERGRVVGPLVARVSLVATLSVALLVATGAFAGIVHLGEASRLLTTTYGQVLLVKLGLVALLLGLGFVNRQVFTPAYRRADGALPEGRVAITRFRSLVATEAVLMALVLAATGALAGIAPQDEAVATGARERIVVDGEGRDFAATLTIAPGQLGLNDVTLATTLPDGAPLTDAKRLTLVLIPLDRDDLPPVETVLEETDEPGRFQGNVTIPLPGEWLATAKLQRETAYDDQADFFFTIPQ